MNLGYHYLPKGYNIMRFLKYIVLLSVLALCNVCSADNVSKSFSLESPLSGISYGPFVLQDNFVAEIDAEKYLISLTSNGFLQLKDMANHTVSEPYEFTEGRMIRINESLFTIVNVKEIQYVKPIPAPKPISIKKPVIKPVVATTAVAATATAVTKTTKNTKIEPTYKPESEMWTTQPKKEVKTTTKPKSQVKPKTTVKQTPKPKQANDASTYFTSSKYKPQTKKTTPQSPYKASSSTVPYKPKSSTRSKLRPHKDIAFSDRLGISIDISALEKVTYDYKVSDFGSTEAEISRNSMSVRVEVMPFTLELGKVFRADWSGQVSGTNLPFQNIDLSNGSGWWWDLNYRHPLWTNDSWLLSATADGSYRKEDYDLSYGALKDTQINIPPEGTNTEATVKTIQALAATTQPAVFTEKILKLGLTLSYKDDSWGCWAAADVIAYHTADIESKIATAQGDYTIDVERTDPFIFTLGASMQKAGINWFSTISLAGESAIRFGANYKF